jgi:predicted dehydrogenase
MGGAVNDAIARPNVAQRNKPRLGFVGLGWIGMQRMEAIARSGIGVVTAFADPLPGVAARAHEAAPEATFMRSIDELLDQPLDGVVIATPSALHAEHAVAALSRGIAVFCQKPLGRDAGEAQAVVAAARKSNRLLAVDLSYRFTLAMTKIHELIGSGEIGDVYAADLVFHNAYGPDKPWFYDRRLSGGGAVIDLGTHLVDLALWALGHPRIVSVRSRLYAQGRPVSGNSQGVEDHAVAELVLGSGTVVRLACSWKLHAGCDCAIEAAFYGTRGGLRFRNVEGSFYDFAAELMSGTARRTLCAPPDAWGGRAAVRWAEQLAQGTGFDPEALRLIDLARVIDRIYEQE